MAIETPHKHIGFNVQADALIQRGTIHVNPLDWPLLHAATTKTASEFSGSIEDAANDTQINATQVGPISGPDAGTGPLISVGQEYYFENLKVPPAWDDAGASEISPVPEEQPYPTSDVPAVPTSTDGVLPEFEPAPLPEHHDDEHHEG